MIAFRPALTLGSVPMVAVAIALLPLGPACERLKSRAQGGNGEVTIITDLAPGSPAVRAAEQVLGRDVFTPLAEPAFQTDRVRGDKFEPVKFWRNLVLIADLSRSNATTDLTTRIVGETVIRDFREGRRIHILYSDVWARGQTVLILAGIGEKTLADAITERGDEIYGAFEQRVTHQILKLLYLAGEQATFSRRAAENYGWSLRIPNGYRIGEDAEARFVQFFMREGGSRLLFVHWQDSVVALPSPEACLATRERLAATYYDGDFIDSLRTGYQWVDFQGRRAVKLLGVWQNDKHMIGGPFRTYCFVDAGRLVMIDLAVFDPSGAKQALLRQLEAIALTFRDHRP